jgi:hypothetical protein
MHDTLKKPHDLQTASFAIRFPERAARTKNHGGDFEAVDAAVSGKTSNAAILTVVRNRQSKTIAGSFLVLNG